MSLPTLQYSKTAPHRLGPCHFLPLNIAADMSDERPDTAKPDHRGEHVESERRSKRFRFKSRQDDTDDREQEDGSSGHKRHSTDHESSHRRRKRQKSSRRTHDKPDPYSHSTSRLSPNQAFRESLFDALGDDEGASFWEGVYGQPIHTYPDTYQDEETGDLERMTEDEYAQFVRRKMWEKSWEGIEAAKEERRRENEQAKQRRREEEINRTTQEHKAHGDHIFDTQIEASLRRGEHRKDRKRWQSEHSLLQT